MLATYMRRMRNSNLEIRIAVSSCRPQWRYLILIQFYSFLRPWNRVKFWTYLDWAYPIPLGGPFITLSTILAEPFFFSFRSILAFSYLLRMCCRLIAGIYFGTQAWKPCALYSGLRAQNNGRSTDNVWQEWRLDQPKASQTLILEQTNKSSPVNLSFCLFVKIKSRSLKENSTQGLVDVFPVILKSQKTRLDCAKISLACHGVRPPP